MGKHLKTNVLFLNLAAFHYTGGIEKVNRTIYKALSDEGSVHSDFDYQIVSVYDNHEECKWEYADENKVYCCRKRKLQSFVISVWKAVNASTILVSHINLAPVAVCIKWLFPQKKLILLVHGIEIWGALSRVKKKALSMADQVLAVSHFTKQAVIDQHQVPQEKVEVVNNCLDPFLHPPACFGKPGNLLDTLQYHDQDYILFTLTRLNSGEQYKGYDRVLAALAKLVPFYPQIKYIIGGKGDETETARIRQLVNDYQLSNHVHLTGFIPEDMLQDYFLLADTYIMPSTGEGFGIAFIEAGFYGLPVIGGNADGSRDAVLSHGRGTLVSPEEEEEIQAAILEGFRHKDLINKKEIHKVYESAFSFDAYKKQLIALLR